MTWHHVCCGMVLEDGLGKYGCPNCCGDNVAVLTWVPPVEFRDHVREVVSEYLACMEEWRRLQYPGSRHALPKVIPHSHPIVLRLRSAQAALASLAAP